METLTVHRLLKAVFLLGLSIAVYRAYCKWRVKKLVRQRVTGKVVLITGASSGLGESLARRYHSMGSKVILAARNKQQLERIKFQLDSDHTSSTSGQRHSPKVMTLDLCDPTSLTEKAREAVELFGRIDILINNAGVSSRGAGLQTSMDTDRMVMEVNFFGTVAFTKGIVSSMVNSGGGHVVVVSSLQGMVGIPMRTSYAASKHALQGYFDCLRLELASQRVHVTVVSPGYIRTQLSMNALTGDGTKHDVMDKNTAKGISPDEAARHIVVGVARGKRDLVLATHTHRLAIYLKLFAPRLLDWILIARQKSQSLIN